MEIIQNIIIFILLVGIIWLYFDRKDLKYWRDYYEKEMNRYSKDYFQMLDVSLSFEEKLNKAEEIISQQKQELLTRKTSKKK